MQREAQSLSGDDLSDRPDKVPVRRELPTRVGRFEFLDSLVDLGHRGREGNTLAYHRAKPCELLGVSHLGRGYPRRRIKRTGEESVTFPKGQGHSTITQSVIAAASLRAP